MSHTSLFLVRDRKQERQSNWALRKNKSVRAKDDIKSNLGKKYAWYRTPSNPRTSSQQGTHIQKGWTETVYPHTNSQATTRESRKEEKSKRISAMSRLGKSPSRSEIWKRIGASQPSLKIQEGERESVQVAESMQPEVHSLKGKSPYVSGLPPKVPENQKIRFFGKTPFILEIAASPAKRIKFPAYLTYKGETCPNAHLAAFNNEIEMEMDSHTDASWCKNFILTLIGTAQKWAQSLPDGSISSFDELAEKFKSHFSSRTAKTK